MAPGSLRASQLPASEARLSVICVCHWGLFLKRILLSWAKRRYGVSQARAEHDATGGSQWGRTSVTAETSGFWPPKTEPRSKSNRNDSRRMHRMRPLCLSPLPVPSAAYGHRETRTQRGRPPALLSLPPPGARDRVLRRCHSRLFSRVREVGGQGPSEVPLLPQVSHGLAAGPISTGISDVAESAPRFSGRLLHHGCCPWDSALCFP